MSTLVDRLARILLLAPLVGVIAGYASALVTRTACENRSAQWVNDANLEFGQSAVFVGPEHFAESARILRRIGVTTNECLGEGPIRCWPAAFVEHGEIVGPFLPSVRWAYARGPRAGYSSRRRFVCLFGFVVFELIERDRIIS